MRRGLLIGLLAAGTVLGFSFAFARHCAWHGGYAHHGGWGRHGHGPMALEDRAANACVRAAERVMKERGADAKPAPPAAPPAPPPAATP